MHSLVVRDLKVEENLISDTLKLVRMDPLEYSKIRQQDRKGARMRLYGWKHWPPSTISKLKHTPNQGQVVFRLNHDFEDHESKNLGKYDRIHPIDDREMQNLYNTFLVGAESIFKHSFDMKVKETIAKVRDDRKQEQLAREEEKKRRSEKQKRAQRVARNAALVALAAKDASKNATLCTDHTPTISLDHMEHAREGMIGSPKGLKEDCCLGQQSSKERKFIIDQHLDQSTKHTQGIHLDIINANDNFVCSQEMTVQEKVD
jgi:hypothetical protein